MNTACLGRRADGGVSGVIPEDVRMFLHNEIKSTWALDLLLAMKAAPARAWAADDLVAELRGSRVIVSDCLSRLVSVGVVAEDGGAYRYNSTSPHDRVVSQLVKIYAERPIAVIREILAAPNDKIQSFVEAFRLKKD
jgi:hypothetical protein